MVSARRCSLCNPVPCAIERLANNDRDPCCPRYAPCVRLAGGSVVPIPLQEEGGFRVPIPQLREALRRPSVKMLITNSPHNPTGAVMTRTGAATPWQSPEHSPCTQPQHAAVE